MLDEAHERTINTDVLFGLLKVRLCSATALWTLLELPHRHDAGQAALNTLISARPVWTAHGAFSFM